MTIQISAGDTEVAEEWTQLSLGRLPSSYTLCTMTCCLGSRHRCVLRSVGKTHCSVERTAKDNFLGLSGGDIPTLHQGHTCLAFKGRGSCSQEMPKCSYQLPFGECIDMLGTVLRALHTWFFNLTTIFWHSCYRFIIFPFLLMIKQAQRA